MLKVDVAVLGDKNIKKSYLKLSKRIIHHGLKNSENLIKLNLKVYDTEYNKISGGIY